MASNHLPRNPEALFAVAEELANVLAETTSLHRIEPHAEARLRACIAGAIYARNAYAAARDAARRYAIPHSLVFQARRACIRSEHVLRVRMQQLIAQIGMQIDEGDPEELVEYVFSLNG